MDDKKIWMQAKKVWDIESTALSGLSDSIDRDEFLTCVKLIAGCKGRIITTGAGTSAVAAKKISHSLSCIERPSFFLVPSDAVHGALGAVCSGDIVILISKGGNTKEVVDLIGPLKAKKAVLLGVTEDYNSSLAKNCDYVLKVSSAKEADSFNMLATTSTLAVVSVFDAICIVLMEITGFTIERFAVIHPEGAVGQRLKRTIKGKR